MQRLLYYPGVIVVMFLIFGTVSGQDSPKIGIRAGVGTDISLGLTYGFGVNYLVAFPQNSLELEIAVFGGSFEETTDESIHTYVETTDLIAFVLEANYLFGYTPTVSRVSFLSQERVLRALTSNGKKAVIPTKVLVLHCPGAAVNNRMTELLPD